MQIFVLGSFSLTGISISSPVRINSAIDILAKYPIPKPFFTNSNITSVVATSILGLNLLYEFCCIISSSSFLVLVFSGCSNNGYFFNSLTLIRLLSFIKLEYLLLATNVLSISIKSKILISSLELYTG